MDGNFDYQHIINGNFGPLKGPIATFTIIFEPLRVPIVITNEIFTSIWIFQRCRSKGRQCYLLFMALFG